jgi:uncharacterized protein YndB with AHSA1/START domain
MATQSTTDHVARATTTISAPAEKVWDALTNPAAIKQYMMGATVTSDWKVGSPITWKGEIKGKSFEDKGRIQRVDPNEVLEYTHYSPMSGEPDAPENYHVVTVSLSPAGNGTRVDLVQTKNPTDEGRKHSEENWNQMLAGMKKVVESGS